MLCALPISALTNWPEQAEMIADMEGSVEDKA
jgi:hypothetical protein